MKSLKNNIIDAAKAFCIPEPECGWDEHDKRVSEALDAKKESDLKSQQAKKLVAMGVPYPLHAIILAKPLATAAIEAARAMLRDQETLAVFSGNVGCGKTLAAATWLLHAPTVMADRRRGVGPRRFVTALDYCLGSVYDQEFSQVLRAAYLVIDDLGQEYEDKKGFSTFRIDELISRRHADMLPTIITTNLTVEQIGERYGDRVASRLHDAAVTALRGERDLRKANP